MNTIQTLGPGDLFPALRLQAAGGEEFVLPNDIATDYAIVLFYRGHW